jgi:para-nitrobenzyl esterase
MKTSTPGPENVDKSKRTLLSGASLIAGAACGGLSMKVRATPGVRGATHNDLPDRLVTDDTSAIAQTACGRVLGYISNRIFTFKGIPYGTIESGIGRFRRCAPAKPWHDLRLYGTGVRSSRSYGPVSPQIRDFDENDEHLFFGNKDDGQQHEDCLRINIWTPAVDEKRRPVMFWIHGGGFVGGSSQELSFYDGENLAERGNVVVVSINHRLNIFGFLDLSAYGVRWADSANVGLLDIVDALKWVRENIDNFGGDRDNVLIFGQSGGGGKVSALLAMPDAQGLFHKAAIQSGSMLRVRLPEQTRETAAAVIADLNVQPGDIESLLQLPTSRLLEVSRGKTWGPSMDGRVLPAQPFDPTAPIISAGVPLLVGTVLNEFTQATGHPELELMTEPEARARLAKAYGGNSGAIYDAYKALWPSSKPFDVCSVALAASMRSAAISQAQRKAALNHAPAYNYWFQWKTKILEGRPRSFHCVDLPFVFFNTDHGAEVTGGTTEARELAKKVSDAWIAFARTGNPNHPGLPHWFPMTADSVHSMIFDVKCSFEVDPDGIARNLLPKESM